VLLRIWEDQGLTFDPTIAYSHLSYCHPRLPGDVLIYNSFIYFLFLKFYDHSACQNIHRFSLSFKIHYKFHKSPPLDFILSRLNPINSLITYFPKISLIHISRNQEIHLLEFSRINLKYNSHVPARLPAMT
jgi:hypothetical protein